MAKKSKSGSGFDPIKIFQHASAFHKSYDLLQNSVVPRDGRPPDEQMVGIIAHPAMVLSVFASELYLRCLLCVETGQVPTEHNLKNLFNGLQLVTRRELDDRWDADIRHPSKQSMLDRIRSTPIGNNLRLDLRYAIDVGANSFIELRYFYETEQAFFLLSDFPYLLRSVILSRFPSWGSVLPKPSKGLTR